MKCSRSRSEGGEVPDVQETCAEAFALAQEMRNVELTGLDESSRRALAKAKRRFEDARRGATRAFKNEALTMSDRSLKFLFLPLIVYILVFYFTLFFSTRLYFIRISRLKFAKF